MNIKSLNEGDYSEYRIPGICILQDGTIVLTCECRSDRSDWAKTDISIMISHDEGATWEERIISSSDNIEEKTTWNNPTLIADGNRIHLLYCKDYGQVFHTFSDDFGKTWAEAVEITKIFRNFPYDWNVCAVGPGHGIKMTNGKLVCAIWLANGAVNPDEPRIREHWPSISGYIYSDDGGKTWKVGELVSGIFDANETTLVEIADNEILLNVRHRGVPMKRALATCQVGSIEKQGNPTMSEPVFHPDLSDPMCFGSMTKQNDLLLFSNCESNIPNEGYLDEPMVCKRVNLTLKASLDQGKTWQKLFLVDEIGGYSDIFSANNKTYIFYEYYKDAHVQHLILKKTSIS